MAERSAREIYTGFADAMNRKDWDALASYLHPDYVEEYPQSGERIRGPANAIALRRSYPEIEKSRSDIDSIRLVGDHDRWAVTPAFTVVRVEGRADNTYTSVMRVRYPDGSDWFILVLWEAKNGLIWRSTNYFAPFFEPPEWRRQWVERMEAAERYSP